ncbi:MAG: DNA repair protein RadC [Oscillospiraceae bacterium]|nr:DNA repair protein RadC [Oscillospiraceae bacterium]MBR2504062.1 DNA repair protein RadC [Oscillospiraceae bacterium]
MNLHEGHRQRLKDRFIRNGLSGFEDHNILELLLFFSVPRNDTNEIGHRLLQRFGSISNVFDAPVEELCKVEGIGMHSAVLIKLIPELCSIYNIDKTENIEIVNTTNAAGRFFVPRFMGKNDEEVHVLLLDDKKKIIKSEMISKGTVNASAVSVRKIVSLAVNSNATGVILAHNHPGGVALPSSNDIVVTKRIYTALKLMEINLCDHIIVAGDDFVSMQDSGIFADFDY